MKPLRFVEQPTLRDLNDYIEVLDTLRENRRFLLSQARSRRDTRNSGRAISAERCHALRAAEDRLEHEADILFREMLELEMLHQVQAHDYRQYVSRGLPLPAERRAIYRL